jgi:hypothetical protein
MMFGKLGTAGAWYNCTVMSSVVLLECAAEKVFTLSHGAQGFQAPESQEADRTGATA